MLLTVPRPEDCCFYFDHLTASDPFQSVAGTTLRSQQWRSDVQDARSQEDHADQDVPSKSYPAGAPQSDPLNRSKQDQGPGKRCAPAKYPVRKYERFSD
jgi:hypothetical protein